MPQLPVQGVHCTSAPNQCSIYIGPQIDMLKMLNLYLSPKLRFAHLLHDV